MLEPGLEERAGEGQNHRRKPCPSTSAQAAGWKRPSSGTPPCPAFLHPSDQFLTRRGESEGTPQTGDEHVVRGNLLTRRSEGREPKGDHANLASCQSGWLTLNWGKWSEIWRLPSVEQLSIPSWMDQPRPVVWTNSERNPLAEHKDTPAPPPSHSQLPPKKLNTGTGNTCHL